MEFSAGGRTVGSSPTAPLFGIIVKLHHMPKTYLYRDMCSTHVYVPAYEVYPVTPSHSGSIRSLFKETCSPKIATKIAKAHITEGRNPAEIPKRSMIAIETG